jgi:hypothetical protein
MEDFITLINSIKFIIGTLRAEIFFDEKDYHYCLNRLGKFKTSMKLELFVIAF